MATSVDRLNGVSDGAAIKFPCRVASLTNITLSGIQTIDGVVLVANDRVLVAGQTNSVNNGVYVVSSGAWTRADDFNGKRDIVRGTQIFINEGTLALGSRFFVSTPDPITIGTTALTFTAVGRYSTLSSDVVTFTATAGQTVFTVPLGFDPRYVGIYHNGVRLLNGTDATVSSGTDIVLANAAALDDTLIVDRQAVTDLIYGVDTASLVDGAVTSAKLATVNSNVGTFGSATQIPVFTVNAKGQITAAANIDPTLASTNISDFTEAAQDAMGAAFDSTIVYTDGSNVMGRAAITSEVSIPVGSNVATVSNAAVIGKVLTGFASADGDVASTDTILQAIQKLDGNIDVTGKQNLLINGGFDIWQRGTSGFTVSSSYTADRWFMYDAGVAGLTVSRIDISAQGLGSQYAIRVERTTGTGTMTLGTTAETTTIKRLLGKTVTLSFKLRKGSALTSAVTVGFGTMATEAKYGGIVDDASFVVANASMNTSTFTTFTRTLTIPAGSSALGLKLEFAANQLGGANVYYEIAQVQLEVGSSATPYRIIPLQIEQAQCKRFARRLDVGNTFVANATTGGIILVPLDTDMRAAPSLEAGSGTTTVTLSSGFNSTTAPTIATATVNGVTLNQSGYTGLTSGQAYAVTAQPTTGLQRHILTAEL